MPGDTSFANVVLLLHFDGENGTSVFTDTSAASRTLIPYGGAVISTVQSLYGGAAGGFTSSGRYVQAAASSDFTFPGDFAIEWASYRTSTTSDAIVMHTTTNESATNGWWVNYSGDSVVVYNNSVLVLNVTSAGTAGSVFKRWALARVGSSLRLFREGVLIATTTYTASFSTSNSLQIGGHSSFGGFSPWLFGYLDEVRITKGDGRYTADYTPASEAFPDAATGTLLISGTVRDATGALASRKVVAYSEDTNTLVGTTTSDATTGAYSITTPTDTAHTLVFYPALGESLNALVLRGVLPIEP